MKVLLLSNQDIAEGIIGNPVLRRMRGALLEDLRVDDVLFQWCKNPFIVMKELRRKAKMVDVIHIHFGGAYALVLWFLLYGIRCPKVITFHGTDIHARTIKSTKSWRGKLRIRINQWASFACIVLFNKVGFVAQDMLEYVPKFLRKQMKTKAFIQRLGVDYSIFVEEDKYVARKKLGLSSLKKYVLFSDVSGSSIKRRDIAQNIINLLGEPYELNVMCGVKPNDVPTYINSSDFLLLTSDEEGSPNIIRECLALDKQIFTVDVGDAKTQIAGLHNSAIISRDPKEAVSTIMKVINNPYIDDTRIRKQAELDLKLITKEIIDIYEKML